MTTPDSAQAADAAFDPLELSVLAHAVAMVAEEMGSVLERGALSPNIRERRDATEGGHSNGTAPYEEARTLDRLARRLRIREQLLVGAHDGRILTVHTRPLDLAITFLDRALRARYARQHRVLPTGERREAQQSRRNLTRVPHGSRARRSSPSCATS